MASFALLIILILSTSTAAGILATRLARRHMKRAQDRFWRRWLKRGTSFTDEDFLAFETRFPQKCAVCSMVRFAHRSGLDYTRLQCMHYCPEQSRRARQQ